MMNDKDVIISFGSLMLGLAYFTYLLYTPYIWMITQIMFMIAGLLFVNSGRYCYKLELQNEKRAKEQ